MTERLEEIQSRLHNVEELSEVISAMRSMASSHALEAARSLPAIRSYSEIAANAIGSAIALVSAETLAVAPGLVESAAGSSPDIVLVFSSEHGFVGAFNELLMDALDTLCGRLRPETLSVWIVGRRGQSVAAERKVSTSWSHSMAIRAAGVPKTARTIARALARAVDRAPATTLHIISARSSASDYSIDTRRVLPLDLSRFASRAFRNTPLHYVAPLVLLARLIDEYMLAELARAAMETLASENVARLRAMESARSGIERKLDELGETERRLRQEAITSELLDIVTGANAQRHGEGV